MPLTSFREFALLMVLGVLVDAFVIRTVLVPALVVAFGAGSAWPRDLRSARVGKSVAIG